MFCKALFWVLLRPFQPVPYHAWHYVHLDVQGVCVCFLFTNPEPVHMYYGTAFFSKAII